MIPLSHQFIDALAPRRHELYAAAVANVSAQSTGPLTAAVLATRAEGLLIKTVREVFAAYVQDPFAKPDPAERIAAALAPSPAAGTTPAEPAMPADVWARLTAAIQLDAAQTAGPDSPAGRSVNPGSVLLNPDPLLAPKKTAAPEDDAFDFSSPSRFLLAVGIAVCIGIALTAYILTRNSSSTPTLYPVTTTGAATTSAPASHAATSRPAR
ncbi:MAG TPA: hypothetical protein VHQ47_08345 [Phycisphaerae bacterium]|nr:hypothetical protein [Phycisphaerae bacterium]